MPNITVTDRSGAEHALTTAEGLSLMEAIRDADVAEEFALCGGVCSCATCHVYVEAAFADALPVISSDEDELLEGSSSRRPNSRLSCQVPLTMELSGLRVAIAPAE